jgi:predicted RNA-binding Zn-ribbon protein involved in translation (DUF1610 family)
MKQEDSWRGIAAAMGYEPKAHLNVRPTGKWILDRVAKFRRQVAIEEIAKDPTLVGGAPLPDNLPAAPSFLLVIDKGEPHHTIPMILTCPSCGERHIDEAEFATVAHHTHACQHCGMVWRPAKVNTHGVRFLPGYTNA